MVVFGQKWFYSGKRLFSGKNDCIRARWLYSVKSCSNQAKVVVIQAKIVVFEQKWLYSGKSGCIQSGQKWLYLVKPVFFEESGCVRAKVVVFREKWFYSAKNGCFRAKVVLLYFFLGQKLLYSGKSGSIRAEAVVFGQIGCIWAKVVVKVVVFVQRVCIPAN